MDARLQGALSTPSDIEGNIKRYLVDRKPNARYTSFDFCYNYFQSFHERNEVASIASESNLQLSCLQLGFYLASWGMFRGSTDLLQRSARHLVPLVKAVAAAPPRMWTIDANSYRRGELETLNEFAREIKVALLDVASDILVTKIMLGVFGCVPAFDTNFKKGSRLSHYGPEALTRVEDFYHQNADLIERYRLPTLDFDSGAPTSRLYSRAKVIDMIFFIEGGGSPSTPTA